MYETYLAHHGILGQKWGIRRFQNKDGSLTNAGEKRYGGDKGKDPRHKPTSARKLAKQRIANLEKARQAKAAKKEFEEGKKKALETGTAADILKYKGKLSNQELQAAVNRINLEQQLSTMAAREVKTGWDKADDIMSKVGKLTDYSNKAINAYNVLAKINNSFNDQKMQVIDGVGKKSKDFNKLIKTGSPEEILRAVKSGKLSKAEREEAINRLNAEKVLSKMVEESNGANKTSSESKTAESASSESKTSKTTSSESKTAGSASSESQGKTSEASKSKTETSGGAHGVKGQKWQKGPIDDGTFEPKARKNYSTSESDKDRRASEQAKYQRAQEWAERKSKANQDFYEAKWTDVKDSAYTSSGWNYAKNADFMTLPSGQVIPLLPEPK